MWKKPRAGSTLIAAPLHTAAQLNSCGTIRPLLIATRDVAVRRLTR